MSIKNKSYLKIISELEDSVTPPKRFRGFPIDTIIRRAKEEYFDRKLKAGIRKGYKEYINGKSKAIRILLQELK